MQVVFPEHFTDPASSLLPARKKRAGAAEGTAQTTGIAPVLR